MSDDLTSVSLLQQMRANEPDAWRRFSVRYGPRIRGWLKRFGLQDADADNVAQEVALRFFKSFSTTFEYDPAKSFRGWLRTLVVNAWRTHGKNQSRAVVGSGDTGVQLALQDIPDDALANELEDLLNEEVLAEAREVIRRQVSPESWDVYVAVVLRQLTTSEAAAQFGKTVAAVGMDVLRIGRKVEQEVNRLCGAGF